MIIVQILPDKVFFTYSNGTTSFHPRDNLFGIELANIAFAKSKFATLCGIFNAVDCHMFTTDEPHYIRVQLHIEVNDV